MDRHTENTRNIEHLGRCVHYKIFLFFVSVILILKGFAPKPRGLTRLICNSIPNFCLSWMYAFAVAIKKTHFTKFSMIFCATVIWTEKSIGLSIAFHRTISPVCHHQTSNNDVCPLLYPEQLCKWGDVYIYTKCTRNDGLICALKIAIKHIDFHIE